jgi:MipA family protein
MLRLLLIAVCLAASPAAAETRTSGFVSSGLAVVPEFEGSADSRLTGLLVGRIVGKGLAVDLEGLEARVDLAAKDALGFGPVFRLRPGRDRGAVADVESIDDAFEIGGFVRLSAPIGLAAADAAALRLDVVRDVADGHGGALASLSARYALPVGDRLHLTADVSTSYASRRFARTYYGVGAGEGLDAFAPNRGFRDVGASLAASYRITERIGVLGIASVRRLLGDAARSPIAREGSRTQPVAAVGLTFAF